MTKKSSTPSGMLVAPGTGTVVLPAGLAGDFGVALKGKQHIRNEESILKPIYDTVRTALMTFMNSCGVKSIAVWLEELASGKFIQVFTPTPADIQSGKVFRAYADIRHFSGGYRKPYDTLNIHGFPPVKATTLNCNKVGLPFK